MHLFDVSGWILSKEASVGKQGGLKIWVSSMPEDILALKHDYESVMVIDRVSEIPLVLRVGSS